MIEYYSFTTIATIALLLINPMSPKKNPRYVKKVSEELKKYVGSGKANMQSRPRYMTLRIPLTWMKQGVPTNDYRAKPYHSKAKDSKETSTNCFKKSGFKVSCDDENPNPIYLQETEFEGFSNFDNDLASCGELVGAEIVISVLLASC
ncbi:hypothetical protein GWI33_022510 [Rhynchophorus ferrugineus]|uniref:Uncharacterized protein n=1 Tax=Rhynchophorus ferrugineus TaxID=354439 RepID=A0A834IUJ2_RHYFE|nr:hypothetical protein GWI33_022510 [Rhynchophorus ferrugineus]